MLSQTFKSISLALLVASVVLSGPARAVDGQVVITHAKVLSGDVSDDDDPGYPGTISEPGSYVLGSNLAPGSGLDGILVEAPDVTIDLNGFRISGGPAGGANNARIGINARSDRLRIKNGTIGAFKLYGIYSYNHSYLIVENMMIVNGNHGVYNQGSFARIQNSTFATNTGNGVFCDKFCHVEGNVVSRNGFGVVINSGGVLGNTILSNGGAGIVGPSFGSGAPRVGFGNNTLIDNNGGGAQTKGYLSELEPNLCVPGC